MTTKEYAAKIRAEAEAKQAARGETTEEKLEAIIDNPEQQEPEPEQSKEPIEADDLTAQIGGQALDVIVPGADTALEIAEAFSGEVINEGASQTQQTTKKRKKKLRFRKVHNEQSGGME